MATFNLNKNIDENETNVHTETFGTPLDLGTFSYTLSGADAALFTFSFVLDGSGNAIGFTLAFSSAPDFEIPSDADMLNDYDVSINIIGMNGATSIDDDYNFTVDVDDVDEIAPIITIDAIADDVNMLSQIVGTTDDNGSDVVVTIDDGTTTYTATVTPSGGTWTATIASFSPALTLMDGDSYSVSATSTDAAGNVNAAVTESFDFDTSAPTITDAFITVTGGSGNGLPPAFIDGDTIQVRWDAGADGNTAADIGGVTADLTAFGGSAAQAMAETMPGSGIWVYSFAANGSTQGGPFNVTLTATDTANNSASATDSTNSTVDTVVPALTATDIVLTGGSGTSDAFIAGDTVTVTVTAAVDAASVVVDLSEFGGSATTAASFDGTNWVATHLVAAGAADVTNASVDVTVTDDAGNASMASSADETLDNEAPNIVSSDIVLSGASGTGGTYVTGDTVTVTVNAATDAASVEVDLSEFGGSATAAASFAGGVWTATYVITAGMADVTDASVDVTVTDDAGQTSMATSADVTLDNEAPAIVANDIALSGASGTAGAYIIGDTVTVTVTAAADAASVAVDLSDFGGSATAAASFDGTNWVATHLVAAGAADVTNASVDVTVTDDAGQTSMATSADVTFDNEITIAPALSVGFDDANMLINAAEMTATSVTISGIDGDASGTLTITSGGGGTPVVISGITSNGPMNVDLTGLLDGPLTATLNVTDDAGNTASASGNSAILDQTAPATLSTTAVTIDEYVEPNDAAAAGQVLASFSNDDAGPGGLSYSFAAGSNANNAFALVVNGANTELQVADPTLFDFEDDATPSVDIVTEDAAGNTTTTTFTVTLNDLNDAPEITPGGDIAATITERVDGTVMPEPENDPTNFGEFGSVFFSDDDITDSHSVSVTNISTTNASGFVGVFLAGLADPANGDGSGRIDWTFGNVTPAPAPNTGTPLTAAEMDIVDALADGETIVQVFRIAVTDLSGTTPLTTTQDVTITIAGTNDAPVISVGGTDSDSASLPETDAVLMASGTLSFEDVDTTDIVDVDSSSTPVSIDAASTFAGTLPAGLDLQSMFSADMAGVIGNAATTGSLSWNFNSGSADAFDFLAAGETLILEYTVTATDDSGTGNDSDTQTVTITITGTNDAPVIDAIADTDVTETSDTTAITATINASFTDVDLDDVGHTAAITDASIAGVTNGQDSTALTAFITSITPTKLADSDSGSLAFAFSAASTAFDYLAQGETATITYTVTLNDGDGGTTTQTFDVIVTGTNDLPTVVDTSGAATEDGAVVTINFGAITDVDLSNTHTYQIVTQPTEGSVSINATDGTQFDFDPGADFQDLAAGETRNVTFTYTATDNDSGVSMPATATITVTGTNDAPVISVDTGDSAAETIAETDAALVSVGGTLSVTDVDLTDEVSVSVDGLAVTGTGAPADVSALQTALLAAMSVDTGNVIADGVDNGTINWSFDSSNGTGATADMFDFLSLGQTLILTYTLEVSDGTAQASEDVVITITGTNDGPVANNVMGFPTIDEDESFPGGTLGVDLPFSMFATDVDGDLNAGSFSFDSATIDGTAAANIAAAGISYDSATGLFGFDAAVAAYQYLSDGEEINVVVTFTVTDDQNATDTGTVTFTVRGTNDQPVITLGDDTGAVSEDDATPNLTDTGSVTFSDIDDADTLTSAVAIEGTPTTTGPAIPAGLATALSGAMGLVQTGSNDGTINWTFTLDNSLVQYLADGETITATYRITLTDDSGAANAATTQDVTITITGTNDDPTLTAIKDTGAVTETDAGGLTDSGSFTLEDVDVTDAVSVSGVVVSGTTGDLNGLTSADLALMFSTAGDLDNTEVTDTLSWTFNSGSEAFDHLGAGESLVINYDITVDDGIGGSATETVTVTINGTNDRPEIASGATLALDEQTNMTGAMGAANLLSGSGTLALSDADNSDTHSITDVLTSVVWAESVADGGATILNPLPSTLMASLAVDTAFSADNATNNNDIDWSFSIEDQVVDFLAEGETLTVTYTITADDGEGFDGTNGTDEDSESASQTVVITLTGANDVPTLSAESFTINDAAAADGFALSNEDTGAGVATTANGDFSVISGTLDGADVDLTDSLTYSIVGGTAVTGGTSADLMGLLDGVMVSFGTLTVLEDGSYTFAPNQANINALDESAAGDITLSANIQVTDGTATTTSTLSIALNGVNDDPVIITPPTPFVPLSVSEFADGSAAAGMVENTDNHVQSLTITFDDAEIADEHTATIVPVSDGVINPALGDYIGTFSSGFPQVATGTGTGTVTFQFTVNDSVLDNLTEGETITQAYQLVIDDDAGGSVTENITVTITGTNDAPEMVAVLNSTGGTAIAADFTVAEDSGAEATSATTTQTVEGTLTFNDVDVSSLMAGTENADTHTVTAAVKEVALGGTVDAAYGGPTGTLTIDAASLAAMNANDATGNAVANSVDFDFDITDGDFDFLRQGEVLTITYTVTIDDGNTTDSSVTQDITFTITGTNDAPSINTVTFPASAIAESAGDSSAQDLTAAGTVTVDDADHGDTLTGEVVGTAVASLDGTDISSDARVADLIANAALTFGPAATSDGTTQTLAYTYSVDDADIDFLADGETLTLSYTVQVDDGTTDSATDLVIITITGTNDAPVIEVVSGTDSDSDSLAETDTVIMADGTLSLSDVDATDVVTVTSSITATDIGGTFGGTLPLSVGDLDNMFTTSTAAVAGGAPNDAVISWDFASANAADFDFLSAGETLILSYTVTATDDSGTGNNNDTQTVTITITGTNDAPTIDAIADEAVTETTDTSDITATINATFTDVDLNDVGHTATITDASIAGVTNGQSQSALAAFITSITPTKLADSDSGSLAFAFSAASTAFDYLAQGQTATITYTVTLDDGDSGTTTQTFDVVVTGTNDLPLVADASGAATEDGAVVTINFGAITDVDLSNTHTYQIVTQPTEGSVSINATDGTQFDFDPGADFQDLAAGETRNVTFTYTATDNDSGVSMPATATITVTGTNDGPVITGEDLVGAVTEDAATPDLTDSGTIEFTDVDVTDTHNASAVFTSSDYGSQLGTLTASVTTATTGGLGGQVTWNFTVSDAAVQFLAADETVTETYTITLTDGTTGDDVIRNVLVTITGTNDAPTVTAMTDVSSIVDEGDGALSEDGSFNVEDVDLTDVVTVSNISVTTSGDDGGVPADLMALFTADLNAPLSGADTTGTVDWTFGSAAGDFDYLAHDESVTLTYTVTLTDDAVPSATVMQNITITINGTNDAPTVTAMTDVGSIVDEGDAALSEGGSFDIEDVDLTDVVTVSNISVATSGDDGGVPADLLSLFTSELSDTIIADGATTGTVDWTFDAAAGDFDYLAHDESVTLTYTVTVSDDAVPPATVTQNITITINGTNDRPEIASGATLALDEQTGEVGSATLLSGSGTLALTDADATDMHVITDVLTSAVWDDGTGTNTLGDLSSGLPTGLAAAIAVDAAFTADNSGSNDTIDWAFDLADSEVDFLAAGETLTLTYTITADDGEGFDGTNGTDEDSESASQTVVITLTGANDAPVISVETGDSAAEAIAETDAGLMVSGTLSVEDVDISDTVSVAVTSVAESGTASGIDNAILAAMMSVDVGDIIDNMSTLGTINWEFDSGSEAFDYLNYNEDLILTFVLTVTDAATGATDTQDVVVTINGSNDGPVIAAEAFAINDGAGAVDAALVAGADVDTTFSQDALTGLDYADLNSETYTVNGQLDATDADGSAILSFAIGDGTGAGASSMLFSVGGVDYGTLTVNANGTYSFVGSAFALNALDAGEIVSLTANIQVTDDKNATDFDTITITLNGINDAPIAIDDFAMVNEGAIQFFNVTVGATGTDFDAEGHALSIISFTDLTDTGLTSGGDTITLSGTTNSSLVSSAVPGTIVTDWGAEVQAFANGQISYNLTSPAASAAFNALAAGVTAVDTFSYTIDDGNGGMSTATVSVTITGTNDIITANGETISAVENVAANQTGDLVANDTDIDVGDTKAIISVVSGANSSVTGTTGGFYVDIGEGVTIFVETDGTYQIGTLDGSTFTAGIPESLAVTDILTGSFSYTVQDSGGAQSSAIVNFNVAGANDGPSVAGTLSETVTEDDGTVTFDLLDGATDPDTNDTLNVTNLTVSDPGVSVSADGNSLIVDTSAYDSLTVGESASFTYSYDIVDGNGGTVTQSITVTINGANDAPIVASINPATLVEGNTGTANVQTVDIFADLVTVTDVDTADAQSLDNSSVVIASAAGANTALVTDNGDGKFSYDLAEFDYLAVGESAVYQISFDVVSGPDTVSQTVTLTVTGENDGPVASAVTGNADEDGPSITVAASFTDVDASDTHTFTVDTTATSGTVINNGDGTFTYNPNAQFEGLDDGETATDTFTYTVSDGNGGTSTETVTITIAGTNDAPVLTADVDAATDDGVAATGNVLTNDSDVDVEALSVANAGTLTGTYGMLTLNGDGSYSYVVTDESIDTGFTGTDVFNIDVTDGTETETSTLTFNITGQNDAPIVVADVDTATDDSVVATGNVLTNDNDPDAADTLSVTNAGTFNGIYGTLTLNGDGSYSYVVTDESLAEGEIQADVFNINVFDGDVTVSTTLTFNLTGTNDAPTVAAPITGGASEDDASFSVDLLAGVSDVDNGDTAFTVEDLLLVSGDASGVTFAGSSLTVDPSAYNSLAAGESEIIVYSYDVEDGFGGIVTQSATITITGANDAPTISGAVTSLATEDDSAYSVDLLSGANDVDTSDTLSVDALTLTGGDASGVTVSGNSLDVDPAAYNYLAVGESAIITYSYNVIDSNGGVVAQTATITINGANDGPVIAGAVTGGATEDDAAFSIDMLAGATDADMSDTLSVDAASVTVVSGDASGVIVNGNSLDVDPSAYNSLAVGETATIVFNYNIIDGNGGSVAQTATITITGENDAPTISGAVTGGATEDDAAFSVDMLSGANDVDTSDTLSVDALTLIGGDGSGVTVNGNSLDVDPSAYDYLAVGESAVISYSYNIIDGNGGSIAQTATITITGENDAPTVTGNVTATVSEDDSATSVNLLAGANDVDLSDVLNVANVSFVDNGDDNSGVTVNGNSLDVDTSVYNYLSAGETLTLEYSYDVVDGNGGVVSQTAILTITGQNDAPTVGAAIAETFAENSPGGIVDLLAGASDEDLTDTLGVANLILVSGNDIGVTASAGMLSVDANAYDYLAVGENAVIEYSYDVVDGSGGSVSQTATITITGQNDDPTVAAAVTAAAAEGDAAFNVDLLSGASDLDLSDVLNVDALTLVSGDASGVTVNGNNIDVDPAAYDYLAVGESAVVEYSYNIIDGNGGSIAQTATITITGQNNAPVAIDVTGTANEDGGTITVSANFTDADASDTHTFTIDTTSTSGTVMNNGDGTFTYDPAGQFENLAAGESATDTFTYTVDDGNGGTSTAMVTVTITGQNDAPVALAVAVGANEDGPTLVISSSFTDVDTNDTHTFSFDDAATLGLVTNNNDGTFNYNPNGAFESLAVGETATDTFTYTVTDNNGLSSTETVTITITGQNDAPTVAAGVRAEETEDAAVFAVDLLDGASDVDTNDTLSVSNLTLVSGDISGITVSLDGNSLNVDPNVYTSLALGEDEVITYSYEVVDGNGGSVTQIATITITGENDNPVVVALSGATTEDGPTVTVTADFSDVDTSDTHTFSVDTTGTLGAVTDNGDGTFTYDPNGAFEGLADGETATDTFTYTVTDNNGGFATETVTITITGGNDAPVALAVAASANEDGPIVTIGANFSDSDVNDTHTFVVDVTGTIGTVTNNSDGTFDYDPNGQFEYLAVGETAIDTFTYTVTDNNGASSTETVTVTITGQNDAPVALAVSAATDEDGPMITVSANFSDVDVSDMHTFTVDTTGTFGMVVNNGDGTFDYNPNGMFESLAAGETTTDTFTYTVDDGNGGSSTETVTITITGQNDAPVALAVTATADEDGPTITVSANFTDIDASDTHTFTVDTTGTLGVVVNNGDGTFDYDPNSQFEYLAVGETTTDTFTYTVDDGNGGSSTETVTVTITGQNDAPVALNVAASINEDEAPDTVTASFTDVDVSDLHTFSIDVTGTLGSVVNNGDGTFTYGANGAFEYLADGETATDTFTYTVDDGNGGTSTATVTMTIIGQNDAPVALAVSGAANEDGPTITVSANFTDADLSDTQSFSVDTTGTLGVVVNNGDGTFDYDPAGMFEALAVGETATDTFTYTVTDNNGGSSTETVTITITGQNDAPVALAVTANAPEDGPAIIIMADFTDVDANDTHSFTIDTTGTLGSVVNNGDGTFSYDASGAFEALADGETAIDTFTYTVDDGNGGSSTETVTITIVGGNDMPTVAAAITGIASEDDAAFSVDMLFGASDADTSDVLSVDAASLTLVSGDGSGVTLNGNSLDVDPAAYDYLAVGESAIVIYSYDIIDGNGGSVSQTATITITGQNDAPTVVAAVTGGATEDDAAFSVDMLAGTTDVDISDVLSVVAASLTLVSGDASGVTVNGNSLDVDTAMYDYLAVGENAVIVYSYDVTDSNGGSISQTATITITGQNDAPTVSAAVTSSAVDTDAAFTVDLLTSASDADLSDTLNVDALTLISGDGSGITLNGNSLDVDPTAYDYLTSGEILTIQYSYNIIDGNGGSVAQTATITITGTNEDSVVSGVFSGEVTEGDLTDVTSFVGTLTIFDPDMADTPIFADVSATAGDNGYGSFAYSSGEWTFILDQDAVEALDDGDVVVDTFTFTADDGTTQQVSVTINGANNVFSLTPADDVFIGSDGIDIVDGGSGRDILRGGAGDDVLVGGDGNDDLYGGEGADDLIGGAGRDRVFYSSATEGIVANFIDQSLNAGAAAGDTYTSIESIVGSNFDDVITSGNDNNDLIGLGGNDVLIGAGGRDRIFGGSGDDRLLGGLGNDDLHGQGGADTYVIQSGAGSDRIFTYEVGVDVIQYIGGPGAMSDLTIEQVGANTRITSIVGVLTLMGIDATTITAADFSFVNPLANPTGVTVTTDLTSGDDVFTGDENDDVVNGLAGNDTIRGGIGDDTLNGGDGNDLLTGGLGADVLNGGDGIDRVLYTTASTGVTINVFDSTLNTGEAAGDTYISIENFSGSNGDDNITSGNEGNQLIGLGGDDTLIGAGGDDTLFGGDDDDRLVGGADNDILFGQGGEDTFVFFANSGNDTIRDFEDGVDIIEFRDMVDSFADLTITQDGDDAVITSANGTITLTDFDSSLLDAADFTFI